MNRELIRDVLRAWIVPGPHPAYHASMRERVRYLMPVLGRALDALAADSLEQEGAGESDEDEQVRARIAAKALRDFADAMERDDWTHRDDWGVNCAYSLEVRARADALEGF